jgi:Fe-S cluster biosynthesis and repair protein YggX
MEQNETLVLYEQQAALANSSNWKDRISALLLDLFSPENKHKREEHEKFILEYYKKYITFDEIGEASVENLYNLVYQENWEIFQEIGDIDFYENYLSSFIEENPDYKNNPDDYSEDIWEQIDETANDWWQEYYPVLLDETMEYIMEILDKYNLCYEYSGSHDIYDYVKYNEIVAYRNDCQNLMFPEIHLDHLSYCCNHYYGPVLNEEEALRTRLVNK